MIISRYKEPRPNNTTSSSTSAGYNASQTGIASSLFIGVGAVEKNVTAIFQKLGLEDSGSDHRRVLAVLAWLRAGR